jgi:hypothetical protein
VEAVLIILKHATFLRLSKPTQLALIQAELDYRKANIDSNIQEHLNASSLEVSIEKSAGFVMATNISLYIFASVTILSHQFFSVIWLIETKIETVQRPISEKSIAKVCGTLPS